MRRNKITLRTKSIRHVVYLKEYLIRMMDRSRITHMYSAILSYEAEIYKITDGFETVEACEEAQDLEFVGYGESDESLRDALKTAVYETKNEIVRKLRMEAYEEKRFWKL